MAVTNGNNNTASIGFEQQIWAAADILRGNMDAAEYKHVVLGLIFLKYISDKFEARYQELLADDDDVEDKDAYSEVNVFFVPPSARWSVISEAAHKEEIGTVIDDAMRAIEKENKRLKDILPKNYARGELDKRRLGNVVDLFTNIQMIEHGDSKDILGRAYEYCLAKFAATFGAFDDGTLEGVKGFCAAVTTDEIAKQDYILTPGRYVGIEDQEDEIRKRLGAIGYEI